ncbi:D-alanine--D-alanine ligase [Bacillus licheniformis]|uniref:D-alanine--D-alanine ligase n=2 Tax=Bacillus licheniformis TaxID=1402 RepID=DDL_BACLD|nr:MULTISPECIES: D-alanine--D-alanine ligase [Bacillus]Q65N65.1 RecName: Full=D-alanine--D-alanine ligase; AltName: Full=D-Ala-D-Ala ligase; AltName: Full=D-alanylalanine synthetase [Bacillus licheniformis DSM 13 = ATCC 14580]MDP4080884.1 D-alanine--D-alanine ligase [Bacillota bacterium]AAU22144.1 D-alanyl-D-alanine ligase A [Bacillus licheniformis DSM 13 = ATCC 14580]AAU39499.1 D-alanine--D-alanine ligase Ddl [Bacillus licheniformis DSM 13 = ATCC 14580]AKQ71656.1 D-alanine-D-alanine ligase [B
MKTRLGLVYGGKSAEHNVSLQTALAVTKALDTEKFDIHPIYITEKGEWVRGPQLTEPVSNVKMLQFEQTGQTFSPAVLNRDMFPGEADAKEDSIDVVFPLLHGPNGEDGTIQGMLELLNVPYVGNGVLASSAGMDKVVMKHLFAQAGLDQAKYVSFLKKTWSQSKEECYAQVEGELGYPCFVKPANLGSSVGISKCRSREELDQAFELAFQYDRKIVVEEGVIGREIELGVLGNDEPVCSVAGEIAPKKDFYDYKAKYEDGDTDLIIPASLTEDEYETMRSMAVKAFQAIDGSGLVRADFFLTNEGRVLINEVNTMPGFTPFSMFPLLWKQSGVEYAELIEKLVALAIERHEEKQQIKHTF